MTASYLLRLLSLALASFFLLHALAGIAVAIIAPAMVRRAERMSARAAAQFLLAVRLFPPALAAFLVGALCVPSFLWLEPISGAEEIGAACLTGAAMGLTILAFSITRTLRALIRASRYAFRAQRAGRPGRFPGVWIVDTGAPVLSLAGILRPRIVMSRGVVEALTRGELAAALRHELAHGAARDNFKRLLFLLAPGILPVWRGFDPIEHAWPRFAEWAADDRAVHGSPHRSLTLAAALVRVARMSPMLQQQPLVTSLLSDGQQLAARVNRLLAVPMRREAALSPALRAASIFLAAAAVAVLLQPTTFRFVHAMLEALVN